MDFTSDTTNSQDRSSSHLNLEEAVGPPKDRKNANIDDDEKQQLSLLDDEELRALKLQEEKEASFANEEKHSSTRDPVVPKYSNQGKC